MDLQKKKRESAEMHTCNIRLCSRSILPSNGLRARVIIANLPANYAWGGEAQRTRDDTNAPHHLDILLSISSNLSSILCSMHSCSDMVTTLLEVEGFIDV